MSGPVTSEELAAKRATLGPTLASCPHCAGKVLFPRHYGMDFAGPVVLCADQPAAGLLYWAWSARCFNGGCGGAVLNASSAEEAVERWNRRAAQ